MLLNIKTVIKINFSTMHCMSWDWCSCCAFSQCVVTLLSTATSIPKPELFNSKLCLVSHQTALITPYTVILIKVTTTPRVCAWLGHPACALTIDRCSTPVRHLSRITWLPPSVRINAIISPKQNRVRTPIFTKMFTAWRDTSETRQLRQICPCVMNVTWYKFASAVWRKREAYPLHWKGLNSGVLVYKKNSCLVTVSHLRQDKESGPS